MDMLSKLTRIASALWVVFALSGCGSKPVVGVLLAESGAAASYGQAMRTAIELAIEQARADGSYPQNLQVIWADSATNPEQAAIEYEKLADQGAHLILAGVTSGEAKALLPVIERTNVMCLSPSASLPSLTKDSKLFYRIFPSDALEGRRAGRFLAEDQDLDSVLIFTEDSEQARGIEPPFRHIFEQAMQGKVVGRIELGSEGWKHDAADALAAHNPESAYIIAYADKTLDAVSFLREKSFQGVICLTSAFYSGQVVQDNPTLLDNAYFPQPAFDIMDERPLVQDFVKAFRAKTNSDPDIYAAHGFDAMRIALATVRMTDIFETSEIKKTLQFKLEEFPGVTGIIQFNDYGDVHRNPIMFIVHDGQVRNYERYVEEEKKRIRDKIRNLLVNG